MTKMRWTDPPREHDPARADMNLDPKVRFAGSRDDRRPETMARAEILEELSWLGDRIDVYTNAATDLEDCLSNRRASIYFPIEDESCAELEYRKGLIRYIKEITKYRRRRDALQDRLAAFPRKDRF